MTVNDRINGLLGSVAIKPPCRVATTANITLSGLQTIDGVTVVAGDRVLVKDQTTATENGIYEADTSAWSRAKDFNGNRDAVNGTFVLVTNGTANGESLWKVATANPITIGTSSITFENALGSGLGASLVGLTQGGSVQDAIVWVTPEMFGATGDGVTDDAAALQAALNYAGTLNTATVRLQPGKTYLFNSQLTLPTGVALVGHTERLYGLLSGVIGSPSINVANGYYSHIENLNISHASPGSANTAIQLIDNDGAGSGTDPAQYTKIKNVRITNHATGIRVANESTWLVFEDVIVTGCSGAAFSISNANLAHFLRCIADTNNTGWYLDRVTKAVLDTCTAQVCSNTGAAAVQIVDSDNTEINHLWCERNAYHNIQVSGTSRMTRITEMLNQGAGFSSGTGRGIYLSGTTSNTIIDGGWHGGNATNDITIDSTVSNTMLIEPRSTTTLAVNDASSSSMWVSRKMRGITSLSATTTGGNNLRGLVSITGASTTATVTFPTAEPDAVYYIVLGVGVAGGSPASGSLRASWSSRTSSGFTVTLEAAPGVGNTVNVNWVIIR